MMRMAMGAACLLAGAMALPGQEVLTWDEGLEAMAAGEAPAYLVYIGRPGASLLEDVRAAAEPLPTPVIHLGGDVDVTNPYTGRPVPARDLIRNLVGPVHELTGGTVLLFDDQGILIPGLTAIAQLHRNRYAVLDLYARYAASGLVDQMVLADFARLKGLPIGETLALEIMKGENQNFSHLMRPVPTEGDYLVGVDAAGERYDPRREIAINIVTRDTRGEVFLAQIQDVFRKLSIEEGGRTHQPPITVLAPMGQDLQLVHALGIPAQLVSLTAEQAETVSTPRIVLPGSPEKESMQFVGYVPGQLVAEFLLPPNLQPLIRDYRNHYPDIAIGEVDHD